mgnify:CR=1 FL=1
MANANTFAPAACPRIEIHLCVPEDQERHLPKRRRAPHCLPLTAPLPRQGEVLYLSSSSAWQVNLVVHEWRSPQDLRIEIWLEWIGSARHARPPGFEVTQ